MNECRKQRKQLSNEFQQYQSIFIALGDETRQQIFLSLLEYDTVGMRVPEITKKTHLSRPAVSHHLQILKRAGLINLYRVGTKNYYYIDADAACWNGFQAFVEHINQVVHSANQHGYPRFKEELHDTIRSD